MTRSTVACARIFFCAPMRFDSKTTLASTTIPPLYDQDRRKAHCETRCFVRTTGLFSHRPSLATPLTENFLIVRVCPLPKSAPLDHHQSTYRDWQLSSAPDLLRLRPT